MKEIQNRNFCRVLGYKFEIKFAGKRKAFNNGSGKNDNSVIEKTSPRKSSDGWIVKESSSGPSQKMLRLSPWIEKDLTTSEITASLTQSGLIKNFSIHFGSKATFKAPNLRLLNDPFQVAIVENFLTKKSSITNLVAEMESIEWTRKQMDLYEFYQTTDLANIESENLAQFYSFLNADVRPWMEQLTGMKFQKISASCSMYNCGDFLLAHDDLLSDRLIAYVFYLSPWEGKKIWSDSMGGELELLKSDLNGQPQFQVEHKIHPSNNQFVFFKVEKKSYHQVAEVLTKDYPRLTINGWFHGFTDNEDFETDAGKVKNQHFLLFKAPNKEGHKLESIIRKVYLKDSIKKSIQHRIEENSETALSDFFISDFCAKVAKELEAEHVQWIVKGPSNQRKYESLCIDSLRSNSCTKLLLEMMTSKSIFKLLHEYTELDLYGPKAKNPKCSVEIQRWKGGCYTLIGDPSTYNNNTLDLILYFGSNKNVGVITYLTPDDDQTESSSVVSSENRDEPVLLTIYPQNNLLNIVFRSSGTATFTKYCSKSSYMKTKYNYILLCSYKE